MSHYPIFRLAAHQPTRVLPVARTDPRRAPRTGAPDRLDAGGQAIDPGGVPTEDRGARRLGKPAQQLLRGSTPALVPSRPFNHRPVAAPDDAVRAERVQCYLDVRA